MSLKGNMWFGRICLCFLCAAACVAALSGCSQRGGVQDGAYQIYYLDREHGQLAALSCGEKKGTPGQEIDEVLSLLGQKPEEDGYDSVFGGGVQVERWERKQTKLDVYFNQEYKNMDAAAELLLRAAAVQSLVQIAGVDYVSFFVGEEALTAADGDVIGYMRAEDFVQNTGSSLHSYQKKELKLYFSNETGDKLWAEERNVRYNSNISVEKLIVEQLMKGPSETGDKAVLPAEAKVLGVSVKDGVCYVNFDEGFLNMVEQVEPKVTVYALVNSIIDAGGATQVQLLVNGETGVTFQGAIDLSRPFSRDQDIIEEKEE